MKAQLSPLLLATLLMLSYPLHAIEVAPQISDREVIEALTVLKAGQQSLQQQMDQRFAAMDQRFVAMDQRFADMDQKNGQRFDSIDQRFHSLEQSMTARFDMIWSLMLILIASIFGLIGYIVYDRKTAMRPLEKRLESIELALALEHDLELKSPEGSRLSRLIHAMRELAATDKQVAAVLRSFSLL